VSDELKAIDRPVFVGVGEYDITGPAQSIPRGFPSSRDITVFVLADSGHNHNVADGRAIMWRRIAHWIEGMLAIRAEGTTQP
jgi:pimeloyl-ACP methyl ester carboxylesterase